MDKDKIVEDIKLKIEELNHLLDEAYINLIEVWVNVEYDDHERFDQKVIIEDIKIR